MKCICGNIIRKRIGPHRCPCGLELMIERFPGVGANYEEHMRQYRERRLRKRDPRKRRRGNSRLTKAKWKQGVGIGG